MKYPLLPHRSKDSHKGMFGHAGLIGGTRGMTGALLLAGRAALKCGAGRVTLGMLDEAIHVDPLTPELMFAPADSLAADSDLTVLAIGPGLGQSRMAGDLLEGCLRHPATLIIDADGLNLLAQHERCQSLCLKRSSPTVLTPHPGEAARLLGCSVADIQTHRAEAAQILASRFNAQVVLKGAGSELAQPNGNSWANPTGNPALSAPGMGDVLTGILAAFLVRIDPWDALRKAVWLHGLAADDAVKEHLGPEGLTATELIEFVRRHLNR